MVVHIDPYGFTGKRFWVMPFSAPSLSYLVESLVFNFLFDQRDFHGLCPSGARWTFIETLPWHGYVVIKTITPLIWCLTLGVRTRQCSGSY